MRGLLAVLVVAYALHFAWEMAHAPLFATMRELPYWTATAWCARAAGWDLLISAFAYTAAAQSAGTFGWAKRLRVLHLAIYLFVGLAITAAVEKWAITVGRWAYSAGMPTVAGIGLSPILQWLLIPGAILFVARKAMRNRFTHPE